MKSAIVADSTAPNDPAPEVNKTDLTLWYRQPAAQWNQALPVGNGRLGAMVFGGVTEDRLQLNENSVWSGNPQDYNRPGAHAFLPEIRRLIFDGKPVEAEDMITNEVLGERPMAYYQPLADLILNVDAPDGLADYHRELDLDTAIARVVYRAGGVMFTREVFASAPARVIVVRLTCDTPGGLSFSAGFQREEHAESVSVEADTLELTGQADRGKPTAGTTFLARLRVRLEGGQVTSADGVLRVEKADAATLILAAATNYRENDPVALCSRQLDAATALSYPELRAAHVRDHQQFFRRVNLRLGDDLDLPTDERLQRFREGARDESLHSLYFNYGRYLLISSSRPGGLPANLQGIWNDKLAPAWFCGWHFNINVQMNYWPAEITNLGECHDPLFDLIDALRINGRKTARDMFDCPGFVVSHRANAWLFTSPAKGLALWPVGAAWLCQHLWTHYQFSGDRAFLAEKAYPIMKEAAEFLLAWLVPEPGSGRLVSGPSMAPENKYFADNGRRAWVDMGPAMDQQIITELFDNCLAAAVILGVDDAFSAKLAEARARLAGPKVGEDGRLLEWSRERMECEPGHRHLSHLYALYPGWQITPRRTPELAAAARKSLEHRLTHGDTGGKSDSLGNVGWSLAWTANLWARLESGSNSHAALRNLITRCTYPNLMDICENVFQIDGNLGGTAAIAEMLMQSHEDDIVLLPALPEQWATGEVTGLRARGGFEIGLQWTDGKVTAATIRATVAGSCRIRTNTSLVRADAAGQAPGSIIELDLAGGETCTLKSV